MEIKKLVNRFTNTADRQFASILDEFGALVKFLEDQVNSSEALVEAEVEVEEA